MEKEKLGFVTQIGLKELEEICERCIKTDEQYIDRLECTRCVIHQDLDDIRFSNKKGKKTRLSDEEFYLKLMDEKSKLCIKACKGRDGDDCEGCSMLGEIGDEILEGKR
jgi:hypothetical protein